MCIYIYIYIHTCIHIHIHICMYKVPWPSGRHGRLGPEVGASRKGLWQKGGSQKSRYHPTQQTHMTHEQTHTS